MTWLWFQNLGLHGRCCELWSPLELTQMSLSSGIDLWKLDVVKRATITKWPRVYYQTMFVIRGITLFSYQAWYVWIYIRFSCCCFVFYAVEPCLCLFSSYGYFDSSCVDGLSIFCQWSSFKNYISQCPFHFLLLSPKYIKPWRFRRRIKVPTFWACRNRRLIGNQWSDWESWIIPLV